MIILVALMVVASRVLSVRIDDISDSSYVAIDPSAALPVRIDPATITKLFRDQSSYPGSSPPFNEGFYYTVPARLLLYQPPPGKPYPPGGAKNHGNCDNQVKPVAMGEYVQSSQRQFKRSSDQAGIPTNLLPPNAPGQGTQYNDYYDSRAIRRPGYQNLRLSKFSGTSDMRSYNSMPQENVMELTDHARDKFPESLLQYPENILVSHGDSRQGIIVNSQLQGQQNVLGTQSATDINNIPQDGWPQRSGSTHNPAENYEFGPMPVSYGKQQRVPNQHPNNELQFSSYENANSQQYGGFKYPIGFSETVSRLDDTYADSSDFNQNRRPPNVVSQLIQPIMNHHGDVIEDSYEKRLDAVPQSSQIPPSYLVGLKLLAKTQSTVIPGRPIWDSPTFPKHMVEPWASKVDEESAYSEGRYGLQPRPIDSSRAAGRDMTSLLGFKPPHHNNLDVKPKTPWFVLMVPQDSLFRKDFYNAGVKTPWISLAPRTYDTLGQARPGCRKENLNTAESQVIPLIRDSEIEKAYTTDRGHPVLGSLEAHPLLEEESSDGTTSGARSLLSLSSAEREPQSQPSPTFENRGETIVTSRNIAPSIATATLPAGRTGTPELIEQMGADQVMPSVQNESALAREARPKGKVQTIIEEVVIDGVSPHGVTSGSQLLTGQSNGDTDMKQVTEERVAALSGTTLGNVAQGLITSEGSLGQKHQERGNSVNMAVAGDGPSMMITTQLDSLPAQQVIEQGNGQESTTTTMQPGMQQLEDGSVPQIKKNLEDSNSPSQVASYITEGGTGMSRHGNVVLDRNISQQDAEQSNAFGSPTISSGGASTTSKLVRYITTEGAEQEDLREASMALKTGGSSTLVNFIPGNSGMQQNIEDFRSPDNLTTQVEGQGSTSPVTHYVTEGITGVDSVGQVGLSTSSGYNYMDDTGQQKFTSTEKASGPNVGSTTTYLTGTPATEKIVRYVTSPDGVRQEINGDDQSEAKLALENVSSSTITRNLSPGNKGTQQIINEGQIPGISTLLQGGGPASQVVNYVGSQEVFEQSNDLGTTTTILGGAPTTKTIVRYITPADGGRQEIIEEDSGAASGSEDLSTVTPYNSIGGIGPQQVVEQANGLLSTTAATILGATPATKEIIRYVTTPDGEEKREIVHEELSDTLGNGGYSTVPNYVPSVGVGTQQVIEGSQAPQTGSTLVDGGGPNSQVADNITGSSSGPASNLGVINSGGEGYSIVTKNNYTSDSGPLEVVQQANGLGSTTTVSGGVTSTLPTAAIDVLHSPQTRVGELEIVSGNVTEYINPRSIGDHIIEESGSQSEIVQKGRAPPSSQMIEYVENSRTDIKSQELIHESNGMRQVAEKPSVAESTSTLVATPPVSPITQKLIKITTPADGEEREEIVDESTLALQNSGPPSGFVPQSTTTLLMPFAPTTKKIISYITSADGEQREEVIDEPIHLENSGPSSVGAPSSTTTVMTGAPTTKKIIRYITTADGEQREEFIDEPALALENAGLSSGVVPSSTTTVMTGAPTTKKIIRYITTADGQRREEVVDEPSLVLENGGLAPGIVPQSTKTLMNGAPTTTKIIRIITTPDGEEKREIVDETGLVLENGGLATAILPQSIKTLATSKNPITQKVIRIITTADGEQREEIVDEPSLALENRGTPSGGALHSTTTRVNGAPSTKKIVHIIKTADGEEMHEFLDESSLARENMGFSSDIVPSSSTTLMTGAPVTKKIIRYITTADGQRQEIVDEPSLALENGGTASVAVPQSRATLATPKTPITQKIIRIITTADGEERQEIVDESTLELENGGLPSVIGFNSSGTVGTQRILGTGNTQHIEAIPSAGTSTSKIIRYVTNGGGTHQEVPGSQFVNGQGNLQSSNTIVGGSPSTVARYINYPQQGGLGGTRYMQGFQPRQTSTFIKPASYVSGAFPGGASSKSYVG